MKIRKIRLYAAFLIITLSTALFAQVPQVMNYQGILSTDEGLPVQNDTYQITFKIYEQETGGNEIWSETQDVTTNSGIFSVLLGSINPMSTFPSQDAWLSIQVEANPEMTPRKRFASVGYSFTSEEASHAVDADNANIAGNSNNLQGHPASDFLLNNDYVQPISIGLPESTFNMTEGNTWYEIRELTVTVSNPMNLHCWGYFRQNTASGWTMLQFLLKDAQGNIIEWGSRSWRNPLSTVDFVATDITYNVDPGTYTVTLIGSVSDPGTIENVYISLIGLPQTSTQDYSSDINRNQTYRSSMNKPLSDQ